MSDACDWRTKCFLYLLYNRSDVDGLYMIFRKAAESPPPP